ncbi:MAG: hypothetical protein HOV86_23010 [Thermoactinospora sp.]|nr:hypothetical protein [Thermoactinospora sp.]
MRVKPLIAVVPLAAGLLVAAPAAAAPPKIPAGTAAGYVLFDRQAGKIVAFRNVHRKFRSASVSKILIAIDFLERTPEVSRADARLLRVMLRSSDDSAATTFWNRGGKGKIVERMARKLRLADTAPPPASKPGFWGYVTLSAHDMVLTYRYLLDTAKPAVRDLILGHLRRATKCGTDGFDQSFGIPAAVPRPWAVKQGWSGFGTVPAVKCTTTPTTRTMAGARPSWRALSGGRMAAQPPTLSAVTTTTGVPDLGRPVLHTTGLVGPKERYILVLLTAHPAGGRWNDSVRRTNRITAGIYKAAT